jgi:hypothetical protein
MTLFISQVVRETEADLIVMTTTGAMGFWMPCEEVAARDVMSTSHNLVDG